MFKLIDMLQARVIAVFIGRKLFGLFKVYLETLNDDTMFAKKILKIYRTLRKLE